MNSSGGCEENTWASCVHQASTGHVVHLVCGRSSAVDAYKGRHPGVTVHHVDEMVWNISPVDDIRACRVLAQLFERLKADVIHTHSSKAGILGRAAAKLAGVPARIHGVHILPFDNVSSGEKLVYLAVEHMAAFVTDHFIHVSEGTKAAYRSAAVGQSVPHSVVRSGMEVEKFKGASWPEDWSQLVGETHPQHKPSVVLMMAALEKRKRHAEFIQEFAKLSSPDDRIRVLFAGSGPEEGNLQQLIDRLNVGDRVRLLGHRSDPQCLVALSDVSVLCSLREGLPRVIVQSLAGGKPAVVSPFPGIEEIVTHDKNGIVAQSTEAEDVVRETMALIRNPERLAKYTAGAENASVDAWSFASMFSQLDAAYALCLSNPDVKSRLRKAATRRRPLPAPSAANHLI
ncbi:glycosyltransferase [Croceibacterium ferulae]|uniref:glycosyltransferase n=1 Tax=Croceibacterium ferulae TaxID=1854641 RepID=UPI0013901540|nr:glycosyltransferase [Croceibacterium ferulae]